MRFSWCTILQRIVLKEPFPSPHCSEARPRRPSHLLQLCAGERGGVEQERRGVGGGGSGGGRGREVEGGRGRGRAACCCHSSPDSIFPSIFLILLPLFVLISFLIKGQQRSRGRMACWVMDYPLTRDTVG